MTDPGGSQCQVCKNYGCQASKHNRCSLCKRRGHNKSSCGVFEENEDTGILTAKYPRVDSYSSVTSEDIGLPLRRDSTRCLNQDEVDMATRVLIGCQEDSITGHVKEGVLERACRLTGLGHGKMSEIKKTLEAHERPMAVVSRRGKWLRTQPRLLVMKINKCIDTLHRNGIMTSLQKIATSLDFHEGIQLSHTTLGRILHKMGYAYRQPGPGNTLLAKETKEMSDYRLTYLRGIQAARKHREVVYLDESYINSRHQAQRCWLKPDSQVYIPSGKGPQYILYAAGSRNGWVGEPVVFPYRDSGDYHTGMNSSHFEELYTKTCATAEELLGPCCIVMDNAAYHKSLTSEKDRLGYWQKLPKCDVLQAWTENTVPGQDKYTGPPIRYKKQVIDWLRKNPPQGVCKVKEIAARFSHTVLFLPPYCPELNAIETAWGVSKNYVARKNSPLVNFSSLLDVVKDSFKQVTLETWVKLDQKAQKEEETQLTALEKEEARLEDFRRLHPDLIFSVDADSDDDEDEVEQLLEDIEDGIQGSGVEAPSAHSCILPSEEQALDALLSLSHGRVHGGAEAVDVQNHAQTAEEDALHALLSLGHVRVEPGTEE